MKEAKIGGPNLAGMIWMGGLLLAVSSVLAYGRTEGSFLASEYRVPGSLILGVIVILIGVVASVGKRYGSRGALVTGATLGVLAGGLSIWFRFDNLAEIQDGGATLASGWWLAMVASALVVIGGIGGIVLGARPVRETGMVPPPPPPPPQAKPEFAPTHRVPVGGMQATLVPDPKAETLTMLDAGLPLLLLEERGDWAHVRAENGWDGWVDARRLEHIAVGVA